MPKFHPKEHAEPTGQTIPEGKYLCKIQSAEDISVTREGEHNEWWTIQWSVIAGPYKGHKIKDGIGFDEDSPAIRRVKLYCSRLGLDIEADELEITVDSFVDRPAVITTEIEPGEDYQDDQGVTRKGWDKNVVAFAGVDRAETWEEVSEDKETAAEAIAASQEDETPF